MVSLKKIHSITLVLLFWTCLSANDIDNTEKSNFQSAKEKLSTLINKNASILQTSSPNPSYYESAIFAKQLEEVIHSKRKSQKIREAFKKSLKQKKSEEEANRLTLDSFQASINQIADIHSLSFIYIISENRKKVLLPNDIHKTKDVSILISNLYKETMPIEQVGEKWNSDLKFSEYLYCPYQITASDTVVLNENKDPFLIHLDSIPLNEVINRNCFYVNGGKTALDNMTLYSFKVLCESESYIVITGHGNNSINISRYNIGNREARDRERAITYLNNILEGKTEYVEELPLYIDKDYPLTSYIKHLNIFLIDDTISYLKSKNLLPQNMTKNELALYKRSNKYLEDIKSYSETKSRVLNSRHIAIITQNESMIFNNGYNPKININNGDTDTRIVSGSSITSRMTGPITNNRIITSMDKLILDNYNSSTEEVVLTLRNDFETITPFRFNNVKIKGSTELLKKQAIDLKEYHARVAVANEKFRSMYPIKSQILETTFDGGIFGFYSTHPDWLTCYGQRTYEPKYYDLGCAHEFIKQCRNITHFKNDFIFKMVGEKPVISEKIITELVVPIPLEKIIKFEPYVQSGGLGFGGRSTPNILNYIEFSVKIDDGKMIIYDLDYSLYLDERPKYEIVKNKYTGHEEKQPVFRQEPATRNNCTKLFQVRL